ncbi:hypothetical protein BD410DRAFT_746479 [Rickenella mellea]|uniref:DUF1771-domain-containing protein n=1 Tax=Rickenella mellea TaxID=50990 RepID=A0A4Y7Q8E4_9AGAM|nr:hypothetical protein BD410DRAFT_746479 [Rickenella mellea]
MATTAISITRSPSLTIHSPFPDNPPTKFPHTKAQLSAIAKEYKPVESSGTDSDDDSPHVSSALVKQVVGLLADDNEDQLKELLKDHFNIDDDAVDQHVLDLMHKHRDDIAGVPFLFLTPTRRPISRPSSRASSHSFRLGPIARPETPNSAPNSPSLLGPIRRPHTPMTSPLGTGHNTGSYMSLSPASSPTLAHSYSYGSSGPAQFATSLPASPLSSPRLLNAKASEFKPLPRPHSAASNTPSYLSGLRAETPSPDLWAHGTNRSTSRLAIASPLVPDRSLTPNSSLRESSTYDEEHDPFDPFAVKSGPRSFHAVGVPANPSDFDSSNSNSSLSSDQQLPNNISNPWSQNQYYDAQEAGRPYHPQPEAEIDPEAAAVLTDGMTPFDVLSSVFGATLAPSELEEALASNGYDFERAMQWLVDRALPQQMPSPGQGRGAIGAGVQVVPRSQAGLLRGGRMGYVNAPQGNGRGGQQRFVNGRPVQGGNRVCRYFLAGECMRADCRFSHDLERALCRFWLRGTCAKQENCEFLHHLPQDVDVAGLTNAMSHQDFNGPPERPVTPPPDEFPTLNRDNSRRGGAYGAQGRYNDPGRNRFATAVKKPALAQTLNLNLPGATAAAPASAVVSRRDREAMATIGDSVHVRPTVVAPRPSPRIKLRPPALLPTLPTGESVNQLYMAYRARALQLGAARNACLSRAADAWRRGDGAAAKRFSREGHDLNAKMSAEAGLAASRLVKERARLAEQSVRGRDAAWSDDSGDRGARGKMCGGGLGVCLGIAGKDVDGDAGAVAKSTPEERTEALLDLHGLHSNEAAEVLEEFLLGLEREHFFGLAYVVVGEEKHTGTQDPTRGASRARLATGIREWLHNWGYPWSERDGVICVDPLTHMQ